MLEPPSPVATTPLVDTDTSLGQEPVVVKSETGLGLDLSEDRNIESWGSLDEIQQFLTDSVPTSVPGRVVHGIFLNVSVIYFKTSCKVTPSITDNFLV